MEKTPSWPRRKGHFDRSSVASFEVASQAGTGTCTFLDVSDNSRSAGLYGRGKRSDSSRTFSNCCPPFRVLGRETVSTLITSISATMQHFDMRACMRDPCQRVPSESEIAVPSPRKGSSYSAPSHWRHGPGGTHHPHPRPEPEMATPRMTDSIVTFLRRASCRGTWAEGIWLDRLFDLLLQKTQRTHIN